jgi:Lysozyme like domain
VLKWLVAALIIAWVCHQGVILGILVQPWAPFWLSGQTGPIAGTPPPVNLPVPAPDPGNLNPYHGFVSDSQRYILARAAGFSAPDAITATAISIAENGSGDPAALSGVNFNGTRDLGLWQINSQWWTQFGGPTALVDPFTNARAAVYIYGRQQWCAWSTYGPCPTHACGPPCYSSFLGRATTAAQTQPSPNQT